MAVLYARIEQAFAEYPPYMIVRAVAVYKHPMEFCRKFELKSTEACKGDYLQDGKLEGMHENFKKQAVEKFASENTFIDDDHSIRQMLDNLVSISCNVFLGVNKLKQGGRDIIQTPNMVETAKICCVHSVKKLSGVVSGRFEKIMSTIMDEESLEDLKNAFPSSPGPVFDFLEIIEPVEKGHIFKLNVDSLEKILLDPKVADKKVSVIGIAGRYRKGKSFLLNFFLRYLKHQDLGDSSVDNWLEAEPSLLGFNWRGGADSVTSGIVVWSEPFIVKDRNGEEIAILFMDTQGLFDSQSTVKDCAVIFALSTMISSVQIYNLSHNMQERDLKCLKYFTDYGRLVLEESVNSKPFQSLLFVVQDWRYPYDAEYGSEGGQRVLEKKLMATNMNSGYERTETAEPSQQNKSPTHKGRRPRKGGKNGQGNEADLPKNSESKEVVKEDKPAAKQPSEDDFKRYEGYVGQKWTGVCKWFNVSKGFGFVLPDHEKAKEHEDDVFVHQSALQMPGFRSLGEGEAIQFTVKLGKRGLEADEVTGIAGSPIKGHTIRPVGRKKDTAIRASKCREPGGTSTEKMCYHCQSTEHLLSECPTYVRSAAKRSSKAGAQTQKSDPAKTDGQGECQPKEDSDKVQK